MSSSAPSSTAVVGVSNELRQRKKKLTKAEEEKEAQDLWRKWSNEPSTDLDGLVPIAAAKTPVGRHKVLELLEAFNEQAREPPPGISPEQAKANIPWIALLLRLNEPLPYQSILYESYNTGVSLMLVVLTICSYLLSDAVADMYNDRGNFEFLSIIPYWCCIAGVLELYRVRQQKYRATLTLDVADLSRQIEEMAGPGHFFARRSASNMEMMETKAIVELKEQMKVALFEVQSTHDQNECKSIGAA
jgi:hypothetical protein